MQQKKSDAEASQNRPWADAGNASNPTPHDNRDQPASHHQILGEGAEKYLRESANIEDEPDAQDQQDADEVFRQGKSD